MTDFFESYAGKGREAQLGIMPKNRFQAAMTDMFKGTAIQMRTLDLIATTYGTGDPDPREPGEFLKVKWKQFAIDFDDIAVPEEKAREPFDEKMIAALSDLKGEAVRPATPYLRGSGSHRSVGRAVGRCGASST